MPDFIFHPQAEEEYYRAYRWYEERSTRTALRFQAEVENVLTRIKSNPEFFARYDSIHRFAIIPRFPYSVVYQTIANRLHVVAVAHSSRRPNYWRDRI